MLRLLYTADSWNTKLFLAINNLHHPALDLLMQAMLYLGSAWMVIVYGSILAALAARRPDLMSLRCPVVYLAATLLGLVLQVVLKEFFEVPRPSVVLGLDRVRMLAEPLPTYAFPSGHSIFAAVTASAVGWRRGWRWKVPLWLFAFLAGWSRIYLGLHYPVDVVAGLGIGAATGWLTWKVIEARDRRQ